MRSLSVVIGFLSALAGIALVTFFMLGHLGRDSDRVMLGIIGCAFVAGLCFWWNGRGADDPPREGRR